MTQAGMQPPKVTFPEDKKTIVKSKLTEILDTVDWTEATRGAAIMAIDWAQAWVLPGLKRVSAQFGSMIEFALQMTEDYLRNQAAIVKSNQDAAAKANQEASTVAAQPK